MPTRQAHVARRGATMQCCLGGRTGFVARQELHGRLFWRAVKRCDGDSDASVRGVGLGATRYHAGGDGELRFVKMVFMDGLLPGAVRGLSLACRSHIFNSFVPSRKTRAR